MELSKNQHLVGYDISLNSIHPAAWAQEKAKSLGILDLSPSYIEKLSGDNTRQEKDRVMAALMTGYYIKQQNRTLFCKTSQQFFLWTSLIAFSSACQLDSYLSNSNKISTILGRLDAVQYFIFCFVQRDCRLLISTK